MSFILNIFQLVCWVFVGYNIALHNNWASVSFGLGAMVLGLLSAMNTVGKELRKHGNSN